MDRIRLPDYTLRKHKTSITQLLVVDRDIVNFNEVERRRDENSNIVSINPKLISTDETGNIFVWDLVTRRPIVNVTSPSGAAIIDVQLLANKYLVYLSKDYMLRILDWPKLSSDEGHIFEMNVNTLNFANFTASLDSNMEIITLCCCNTQDSETIDVYQVNITTKKLTRIFNHIDFYPTIKNILQNELNKLPDRLGMIMKFKQDLKTGTIFIGFESGIIIGYQIVFNKIIITYISAIHFPEPVLDLQIVATSETLQSKFSTFITDKTNNDGGFTGILLSSSTNNIIAKHYYPINISESWETNNKSELIAILQLSCPDKIEVRGTKISHVAAFDRFLIWSTWSGKVFIKDIVTDTISKHKKSKGNIRPNESSKGNLSGGSTQSIESKYVKIGAMTIYQSELCNNNEVERSAVDIMNSSKQRRFKQFASHSWCFVGYHDGTISMFEIK